MKNICRWISNRIFGKLTKTHASWLLAVLTPAAYALPPQGTVTAGSASITTANPNQLVIDQGSTKAIIDWNSFNIAPNESVRFNTPGANAATLNRVIGRDPSQIFGTLSSNGQLWLINSNGILFGHDAQVNVAGLLASTLDIANNDFLSGHFEFKFSGDHYAAITNQGALTANNGYVVLLAPQIANTGLVAAKLGTVAFGAGTQATLTLEGNKLLNFQIGSGAEVPMYDQTGQPVAALNQAGAVSVDGGQVFLVAQNIDSLLNRSINVSGIVQADSVQERNGKIVLLAKGDAIVDNGRLSVQGLSASESGGKVEIIGHNVGLLGGTSVNASGDSGGGEIRIGRDDSDSQAFEASITAIATDVHLSAEATHTGNGGLIETSGYFLNTQTSHVSTQARIGKSGTWLLDPYDVTISNAANNNISGSTPFNPTGSSSNLNSATLQVALASSNVLVQTGGDSGTGNGNITVNNNVAWSSGNALTLNAHGSIILNAALIGTNDGTVNGTPNAAVNLTTIHGAITDNSGVGSIIASHTTLSAGSSASDTNSHINLLSTGNSFGTLSVIAYGTDGSGNSIVANDGNTSGLVLGSINASGNISITASGDITQDVGAAIDMTMGSAGAGIATYNIAAGQSGSVTLTNSSNDFNQNVVSAGGAGLLSGFALFDNDSSGVYLGNVSTGDSAHAANVSVVAQHGFNQVAATTVNSHGGDVTFKTIAGGTEIHQSGAVQTGGGRMLLDFNYSGTVTQSTTGSIDTSDGSGNYGLVEVRSDGYGYSMEADLDNAASANNFNAIAFENIAGNAMQVNATINNNNALAFGLFYDTAPIGGADFFNQLTINTSSANGAVTKLSSAGAFTAEALSVASNPVTINTGTGNITLTASDNDFGSQAMNLTGGVVQITDHNTTGLTLGTLTTGALTADADSGVTLNGGITSSGNVSLTANNVTTNTETLTVSGAIDAGANTITLNNKSTAIGSNSNAVTISGSMTAGTLNLTTSSGAITQSMGSIAVSGTTTLANSGRAVSLGSLTNDFGTVAGSGTLGVVMLGEANSISLGGMSASDLTVASGNAGNVNGALTQSGALTITGIASFSNNSTSSTASNKNITLTNTSNSFATLGLSTGGNANVFTTGAIALGTVQANALALTTSGNITKANSGVAITVTGSATLNAGSTHNITLNGTNNDFGTLSITSAHNVAITDTNALIFGASTVSGSLNVTTNGALTQSGALSVVGASTLNAGTQSITLTNSSNSFGHSTVTLSGNDIGLLDNNSTGLVLGNVIASGNIDIATYHAGLSPDLVQVSGTAITMTGTGKTANFNVGNGTGQVVITNLGNNFNGNTVNVGQIDSNVLGNVSINDDSGNNLSIGQINSAGDIAVSAAGAIVQVADGQINDTGLLNAQSTDAGIILVGNGSNQFGRVSASSGNNEDIAVTSSNGIVIQNAINAGSGAVTLATTGNHSITDYDANDYIVAGTTNLSTGSTLDDVDAHIDLSNANNRFGTLNATAYGNNGVVLIDGNTNGLTLHTINNYAADADLIVTTTGPLFLTGNITTSSISLAATDTTHGYIQQTAGTITASNISSFESYGARVVSNPPYPDAYIGIDLLENYDSSNQFNSLSMVSHYASASAQANGIGATTVSGFANNGFFNTQVKNGTLTIGSSGISSGSELTLLSINGTGNIAINGNVSSATGISLNANGGAITQQVGTTLSGPVSMSSASTATLNNTGALSLGTINVTNLAAVADNDITQSGASSITVTGTTLLDAGTHSINLGNLNSFGGTITIGHSGITAGAVTLESGSGDIVLSQVDNNAGTKLSSLSVNSAGGMSQSGALNVTGNTQLAAASVINLSNTNNDFNTLTIDYAGNNVYITDANAILFGASSLNNDLVLTSGGDVTQAGALSINGIATLDAGSHNIVLTNPNNDFMTLGLTAGNANIVDFNGIALGTIQASTLTLTTGGDITKANSSVAINLSGVTTFDAGSHAINLSGTNNDFGNQTVNATGGAIQITDVNVSALTLGTISANALTVIASGDITSSHVISVSGPTTLTAGGNINLAGANHLNGVVNLSGGDISFSNITPLQFGNVTAAGNLDASLFDVVTQAGGTALDISGATNINAESNNVTLANSNNLFGGDVSLTGNSLRLAQQAGHDLTLNRVSAADDVLISDVGGVLSFVGGTPTLELRGASGKTITLVADNFNNQNTGAMSPIDLGTGTDNAWRFYLSNLNGNSFNSGSNTLTSGNQAIWSTAYPATITLSGNRYIFATSQTLLLAPIASSMNLTATAGTGTTLPIAVNGTNYSATGFVNASLYDGAFIQDTATNVLGNTVSFSSTGSSTSAAVGTYDITVNVPATTATGYGVTTNNPFGTITISAPTVTPPPSNGGGNSGGGANNNGNSGSGQTSPPSSLPESTSSIGTLFNIDAATAQKGIRGSIPTAKLQTREAIEMMSEGVNNNLH